MLETGAAICCCPRVWTTYDQLLEDWWSVQATIASALDVTWPSQPQAVAEDINAFLAPTLRHFDTSKGPGPRELGPITSRIWQTVQAGLIGDEAALREGFDEMRSIIDELDRLGAPQVARERAEKITFDKLREAAGTAVTIERQAREAAEGGAATLKWQARESQEQAAAHARQLEHLQVDWK